MDPTPPSRSSSWNTVSPSADFRYNPAGEILSGSYRICRVLPGRFEDPVRCSLQEVAVRDAGVPFFALSYCWESQAAAAVVWLDDRPVKITRNLFAALRNARATGSIVDLWIDQLCIDQNNIIDRNEQVSKMGAIYARARGVIIWLGEPAAGSSDAMVLPKIVARHWPSVFKNPKELLDPTKTPAQVPQWGQHPWPAFITLLTRPWFRRLWVIQEVACAKNVLVTCGEATAFWDEFVPLVRVVEAVLHPAAHSNHLLGLKRTIHYIGFMQQLRKITDKGNKQAVRDYASEESMAPYVLTMAKDCEATDHRDKLFAFHHLVRLWNRPDYGIEIEMLYKVFAVQYLERIAYAISEFSCDEHALFNRQTEILYSAGRCNQRLNIPSWVPDWSVPWQARPLWLGSSCYKAGGDDVKEINPTTEIDAYGQPLFRLPLTVKLFDKVLGVGTQSLPFISGGDAGVLSEAFKAWIFDALGLLHRRRNAKSPYNDQREAMARTITADQDSDGAQVTAQAAIEKYDALLESLQEDDSRDSEPKRHLVRQDSFSRSVVENETVSSLAASFVRGRVFLLTERGHIGIVQAGIAAGDHIAIIQGAAVPVVLRSHTQHWHLQCEAFVLGIMNGEAWTDKSIPIQELVLL